MSELTGKVALVTGAGSGIGAALARSLHAAGASVVLMGRTRDKLEATARMGPRTHVFTGDVSREADVEAAVAAAVAQFGRLDILVNNAGAVTVGPIMDTPPEAFLHILQTNVLGAYHGIRAAVRVMEKDGGSIINIASVVGLNGVPNFAAYCSSKAAILNLSRAAAVEFRDRGIRVNCVLPGVVDTPMTTDMGVPEELIIAKQGCLITPEEVAEVAFFLATDASRRVSGAAYTVDNAMSASLL